MKNLIRCLTFSLIFFLCAATVAASASPVSVKQANHGKMFFDPDLGSASIIVADVFEPTFAKTINLAVAVKDERSGSEKTYTIDNDRTLPVKNENAYESLIPANYAIALDERQCGKISFTSYSAMNYQDPGKKDSHKRTRFGAVFWRDSK